MKRSIAPILIMSLTILILACSGSEDKTSEEKPDKANSISTSFRNSSWGMTPDEVKLTEAAIPISDNENVVLYKETFLDMPTQMGYVFNDGKLIKGAYLFEESYENPDEYIITYEKIKSFLIKDFGPPSLDEIKWLDEGASEEQASGQSVCEGKVLYKSEWIELDTIILLLLEGADDKCRQGIVFESKSNYLIENEKEDIPN